MSKVAQCDSNGFFVGYDDDYGGPMPVNCCADLPEIRDGFVAKRKANGKGWNYVEDHRGKEGYVNGEHTIIAEPGPLPEGWTDEYVDPRSSQEIRIAAIDVELRKLDKDAERPLCSVLSGIGDDDDKAVLVAIEAMKITLREERKILSNA